MAAEGFPRLDVAKSALRVSNIGHLSRFQQPRDENNRVADLDRSHPGRLGFLLFICFLLCRHYRQNSIMLLFSLIEWTREHGWLVMQKCRGKRIEG